MAGGFRLGRLFGVEIDVDWSLLIIFLLITFNLGAGVFPLWHPGWGFLLTWGTALAASILFFASVLAHELSHAVVARRQGIPVKRITLFLFGGLAHMEGEPPSPKAEFTMTIVGPITSLALGIAATALGTFMANASVGAALTSDDPEVLRNAFASMGPVTSLLLWLGPINILLGLFNLVPGFPLDGGRVLRSIIWRITGDLTKATRWASGFGRGFAWLLMIWGVTNFFAGALAQGIWLLLIGWFLNNAARMSYQQQLVRSALSDVPVSQVMRAPTGEVEPGMTLDVFVREYLLRSDQLVFPVESGDELRGLISFADVRTVAQENWPQTKVEAVMTPVGELSALPPGAEASRAFDELSQKDVEQIPVVEGKRLLGMVHYRDLLRWLSLRSNGKRAFAPG